MTKSTDGPIAYEGPANINVERHNSADLTTKCPTNQELNLGMYRTM